MMKIELRWILLSAVWLLARGSNDDYYKSGDDDTPSNPQVLVTCEDGIVQVTNITVSCDSPYAFYYGNGAHRNSPYCDYGDKVTVTVGYELVDDIDDDDTIYMLISAYTEDNNEQLFKTSSESLCSTFVGYECNSAGSYIFSKQFQFSYIDGNQTQFVPLIEMSFSNYADGAYTLGGANIDCDMRNSDYYIEYINGRTNSTLLRFRSTTFASNYGIFTITFLSMTAFALVLYLKAGSGGGGGGGKILHDESKNYNLMGRP